jgi:hypothetical protein
MGKEKFMKKIAQRTIRSPKDFMIAIFDELDQNELEFSTFQTKIKDLDAKAKWDGHFQLFETAYGFYWGAIDNIGIKPGCFFDTAESAENHFLSSLN